MQKKAIRTPKRLFGYHEAPPTHLAKTVEARLANNTAQKVLLVNSSSSPQWIVKDQDPEKRKEWFQMARNRYTCHILSGRFSMINHYAEFDDDVRAI